MKPTTLRNQESNPPAFLSGGGEMGQRMRAYDWSQTSLGLPDQWPQSLRTTLGIILNSRFPMFLFWGPELLCFYNDAYRPSLGNDGKHPQALGKPGAEVWPEIWHIIKPLIDQVLADGEATWSEDQLIPIYRNGRLEDVYWTFSYSPVYDESGQTAGVFVTCTETTDKIHNIRQLEESKNQLAFAVESAELGTWDIDLQTYTFTANDRLKEWIGLPTQTQEAFPVNFDIVAEKDQQRVRDLIEKALDDYHEMEFTIVHQVTRQERIVKFKGRVWRDEAQKPIRFNGTLQDITDQVRTRQIIEASELYFRRMADTVPTALWMTDPKGNCTYLNHQWFDLTGQTPEQALGLGWLDAIHPEDKSSTAETFSQANAQQKPFQILYRLLTRQDEYRWFLDKGQPRWDEAGNFDGYIGSVTDVHEQLLAEETVRQSEKRFQAAIAAVQGILWTNNALGQMEGEQPGWAALTGQSYEEYQDYGWSAVVHPDDAQPTIDAWNAAVQEQRMFVFEHRVRMKTGEWGNFSIQAIPLLNPDQTIREWVGVHTNITEQRQVEKALRASEETFRSFADNLQSLAWMADGTGWIYWYNQRWYDYTGTTFEEIQGWGLEKVHHPDHQQRVVSFVKEAWLKDEPWELTFPLRGKDGQYRWFLTRAFPIKDASGQIYRWIGTNTDIHEQILAEEALAHQKQLLETITKNASLALFLMDERQHCVYMNEAAEQMTGYTLQELQGKQLHYYIHHTHPDGRHYPLEECPIDQALPTHNRTRGEEVFVHKDGHFYPVAFTASPIIVNGQGIGTVIEVRTTAEEKRKQQALIESESRFRTLAETLPQMVWVVNQDRTIEYMSNRWKTYSGLEDNETIWEAIAHPYDLESFRMHWAEHFEQGKSFQYDIRLKNKAGEFRWHNFVAEPIKNASGQTIRWVGALTDIHNQKNLSEQLEKLVAERTHELQRSNEDLQQFAHVASHDLKEPVRKIKLFSNFLISKCADTLPEEGLFYLGKIQDAASRMHAMIDGVLLYSSLSTTEQVIESVDVNQVLHTIETDLEIIIKQKQARIIYQNLPVIEGYSVLLYQLFYNLINNSLKFTRPDVSPVITVTSQLSDTKPWVQIHVHDNGIGFRPEDGQKIFKTFVRLNSKDQYEGTGLGLALCHRIVERHGGTITAEGKDGAGAVFIIDLPVHRPHSI